MIFTPLDSRYLTWDYNKNSPSFEMVMKFLRAYGVEIEVFLRETGYLSSHGEPEGMGAGRRVPVISWTHAG